MVMQQLLQIQSPLVCEQPGAPWQLHTEQEFLMPNREQQAIPHLQSGEKNDVQKTDCWNKRLK